MIKIKICSYTFILQLIKVDPFATKTVECIKDNIFSKILKNATNIIGTENVGNIYNFSLNNTSLYLTFSCHPLFFFFFFFLFFSHTTMLVRLNSSTMDQTWALAGGW